MALQLNPTPATQLLTGNEAPAPTVPEGKLPHFHVVGFTGHRHLDDPAGAARAIRGALESLRTEVPGEWIALSSIARGGDQLFVQQARSMGLSWHAILPLSHAEFAADFTPAEWTEAEKTLATADHLKVINQNGDRKDSYLDCGIETVIGSDVLIAFWDGDSARGKGGTADVVEYAKSTGKPVIIIDAATHELRKENWSRLEPNDPVLQDLNGLPEAASAWSVNPFKAPDAVFLFQQKCDYHATHGAPQFRRLIVATVVAHVVASVIGAAVVGFGLYLLALPWLELSCITFALVAAIVLRRKMHSHHSWVRCRLAAEFCRSALATWGLPRAAPLLHNLDLAGARGLARSLYILHTRSSASRPVSIEEFKRIYLEQRIDDQLAYYDRQVNRAQPLYRRLAAGFTIATVSALVFTAFYAITKTLHTPLPALVQSATYYFLPIALPAVAAACISIISINDLQRRVARFQEMRTILEASRAQIASSRTWNSVEHVVLRTERALLREVIEWHSIRSFSGSH
jgi:SMODS and SLOG-associating 2TM effector domain 1